jgi:hypothetical protein
VVGGSSGWEHACKVKVRGSRATLTEKGKGRGSAHTGERWRSGSLGFDSDDRRRNGSDGTLASTLRAREKCGGAVVSKPDALLDHLGALHICLSI